MWGPSKDFGLAGFRMGFIHSYSKDSVYSVVFGLLCKLNTSPDPGSWQPPLTNLSLSVSINGDLAEQEKPEFAVED